MIRGFKALDKVLRGEATRIGALRDGGIALPTVPLIGVLIFLGMAAGACTGIYSVITRYQQNPAVVIEGWEQLAASTVKVPLLFCLTLLITFPSLYVFNALVGSRLKMLPMLRLLVASLAVMMAVLASLGPIVAFFAVSTTSYPFMKLLNVIAYAIAGTLGLSFLLQTLRRLSDAAMDAPAEPTPTAPLASDVPTPPAPEGEAGGPAYAPQYGGESYPPEAYRPGALEPVRVRPDPRVKTVFQIWVIVFGLVGAQMSWVLRPFVGNPDQPFTFLRGRESHFFTGLGETLKRLLGW